MSARKTIFYKSLYTTLLFLTVLFMALLGACESGEKEDSTPKDSEETVSYSVIFKEEGFADVVISVNEGEGIETLPTFQGTPKTGYVLAWDKTELSVITGNTIVNATEIAKKYTITFDLAGGSLDVQSLEVTFDEEYTLPTPSLTGFQFVAWYYEDKKIPNTGTWDIDGENIVLRAQFESGEKEDSTPKDSEETVSYSVIFKEEGFADVVISVNKGEGIETLPTFQGTPKTGYVLAWDKTELSVITGNTIVNAIEIAKKYTITFDLAGGSSDVQSLEVTFDEEYTLPTPSLTGFQFFAWYYEDKKIPNTGTWDIDGENIVLRALFESWEGPFTKK